MRARRTLGAENHRDVRAMRMPGTCQAFLPCGSDADAVVEVDHTAPESELIQELKPSAHVVRQCACRQRRTDQGGGNPARTEARYFEILGLEPTPRNFALEKLLVDIFEAFDLDPRGSFRVVGEQIDGGSPSVASTSCWRRGGRRTRRRATSWTCSPAKVHRRGENTLGLFLAINGFELTAIELRSGNRSPIMLMDSADLYAVLDELIDLRELLRKRREASMTDRVLLTAAEILARS